MGNKTIIKRRVDSDTTLELIYLPYGGSENISLSQKIMKAHNWASHNPFSTATINFEPQEVERLIKLLQSKIGEYTTMQDYAKIHHTITQLQGDKPINKEERK